MLYMCYIHMCYIYVWIYVCYIDTYIYVYIYHIQIPHYAPLFYTIYYTWIFFISMNSVYISRVHKV